MRLLVGRILRPHGIGGELAVEVRTDSPERRFAPGSVLQAAVEPDAPARELVVDAVRAHGRGLLVRLSGVADRTAAEELRGWLLLADSADSPPPADPDEYWDHDLLGLQAVSVAGEGLGVVEDVRHGPAGALLVLRRPDGGESLVPFVVAVVPTVDLAAGRITLDPPPGLLEP